MKEYFKNTSATGFHKILGIGVAGMFLLCACGSYTSVSPSEAYDAGYTIGRIISGS